MTDLPREAKVAAAQLKLKKFQQAKVNKSALKSATPQSAIPTGTAVPYFHDDSNASTAFGDTFSKFPVASTLFQQLDQPVQPQPEHSPLFDQTPVSSNSSAKPRSLADYFGVSSNSCTGADPTPLGANGPGSLSHAPSGPFSVQTPYTGTDGSCLAANNGAGGVGKDSSIQAPHTAASSVFVTGLPTTIDTQGVSSCSVVPTTHMALQVKTEDAEPQQRAAMTCAETREVNSGDSNVVDEDEEIFDNIPTATTEKIMQISRQLNGILETSEQLTTSFGSSTMLNYSPMADPAGLDASYNAMNDQSPDRSNSLVNQNSPMTDSRAQSDGFLNNAATPFMKRSTTPTSTHSASHTPSYVRELEERNIELASLLEKRSRAHERALAKLTTIQEQSARFASQAANDRTAMEAAAQRDLSKAQEQIRAHAQTIGALVAEKTELQTKVNHLERLSQQRAQEIEDLNERMQTFRSHSMEMEQTIASSKVELEKALANNNELTYQLERLQSDVKREKASRENLKAELEEAHSRLNSRTLEINQLEVNINDLRRQLELAQVYATQSSGAGSHSALTASDATAVDESGSKKDWLTERGELLQRLEDQEQSLHQASKDRERLESQYQTLVAQVEQQAAQLRSELSEATHASQEFQLALETARRQLREKEDELTTCRGSLEVARAQVKSTSAPSPVVVESHHTQAIDPQPASSSTDAQLVELQKALNERTAEVDRLVQQVSDLTNQLETARATLAEKETLLADRDVVLATATSERATLSRAMEQNRTLKEQLSELQDAFVQMSNKNDELTATLRREQQALKKSDALQSDHCLRIEQLQAQCAQLESDNKSLQQSYEALKAAHDSHTHHQIEESVKAQSVEHVESSKQSDHDACASHGEEMTRLIHELQASHHAINQLGMRTEELDSILHRMRLLWDWLQSQESSEQAAARLRTTFSAQESQPPVEQFAQLERLVRALIAQRDEEVATQARQNQENLAVIQRLPTVDEWEKHQTAYKQIEAKFVNCMEKISRMDEERARLESVNAQLEMEASTVGEYVTLFTHRRAAAAKRARAREQLLRRLVQDRRRLRARLTALLDSVGMSRWVEQDPSDDNAGTSDLLCASTDELSNVLSNQECQTKFLKNFHQLLQEIGPSSDEKESDSAFSLLSDEDVAEQQQQQTDKSELILSSVAQLDTTPKNNHIDNNLLPLSPLEQLRKQALQHDCPHCQCCVGNLIEV